MEVGGWVQVSLGFVVVENHPKIALKLLRFDCSVHVSDRLPKKFGWGWVSGVSSTQDYFGF